MGLDINIYKNVKVVEGDRQDDDFEWDFIAYVIDDRWKFKIKNLEEDKSYVGDRLDELSFGYSYGTHSWFRNHLCSLVLDKPLGKFYDEMNEDMDFIELIDFADNEGCLDWEVSEKLYNDFVKWDEKAKEYLKGEEEARHFYRIYTNWLEAFKAAKDKGVIEFC